jgi:hypothetical protein
MEMVNMAVEKKKKKTKRKRFELRDKPIEKWTQEDWNEFSDILASLEEVGCSEPLPIF